MYRLICCALFIGLSLHAAETAPAAAAPDEDQLRRWVRQLGADELAQRQEAYSQLEQAGVAAVPFLEKAATESLDVEVREKARVLLDTVKANQGTGTAVDKLNAKKIEEVEAAIDEILIGIYLHKDEKLAKAISDMAGKPTQAGDIAKVIKDHSETLDETVKAMEASQAVAKNIKHWQQVLRDNSYVMKQEARAILTQRGIRPVGRSRR